MDFPRNMYEMQVCIRMCMECSDACGEFEDPLVYSSSSFDHGNASYRYSLEGESVQVECNLHVKSVQGILLRGYRGMPKLDGFLDLQQSILETAAKTGSPGVFMSCKVDAAFGKSKFWVALLQERMVVLEWRQKSFGAILRITRFPYTPACVKAAFGYGMIPPVITPATFLRGTRKRSIWIRREAMLASKSAWKFVATPPDLEKEREKMVAFGLLGIVGGDCILTSDAVGTILTCYWQEVLAGCRGNKANKSCGMLLLDDMLCNRLGLAG